MKTFATVAFIAASASVAVAQVPTYNSTTGIFTCPASKPNGAFCASDSLTGNIIIRCTNGIGQPGNCNDNLSGEPPLGLSYAPCWETSDTSGDAACSKNCIVYGGSSDTFTLPNCTPTPTSTSSSSTSTLSSTSKSSSSTSTSSGSKSSTSSKSSSSSASTSSSSTSSATGAKTTSTSTTAAVTTTHHPSTTLSSSIVTVTSSSTGSPTKPSNGTVSTSRSSGTPVGPTTTTSNPPAFTGGAVANSGSVLAAVGLIMAYFL